MGSGRPRPHAPRAGRDRGRRMHCCPPRSGHRRHAGQTGCRPDRQGHRQDGHRDHQETNCGRIVLSLDGAKAPTTVASFVQLAQQNYWKNAPCHRLTTSGIFVLQCGDPTRTGNGDRDTATGSRMRLRTRCIRGAPWRWPGPQTNSNGGQFFIVYKDSTIDAARGLLNFRHCHPGAGYCGQDRRRRGIATGSLPRSPSASCR